MSVEQSEKTGLFLRNNNVTILNCMGGEIFCHPQWFEVLSNICKDMEHVRIVTNGDWIGGSDLSTIKKFMLDYPAYMAISNDRWHTNKNVDRAAKFCKKNGIIYKIATKKETTEDSVVPAGRSKWDFCNLYSMWMTYCSKPDRKYNFLIDESGAISKCLFGAWEYDNIDDYLNGGFAERFKQFGKAFYSAFIPSCRHCLDAWDHAIREKKHGNRSLSQQ